MQKCGERIFLKQVIGNESLNQNNNGKGVRMIHVATSKNVVVKSTNFPQLKHS
jgi:hypothetical protein